VLLVLGLTPRRTLIEDLSESPHPIVGGGGGRRR
jgi:hypothetical protein